MFNIILDISVDEQALDQALLSLDTCDENRQLNGINTNTAVSVAELPSDITDSLNVAAKQLSLLYESVNVTITENDEESGENLGEEAGSVVEPCLEQTTGNKKKRLSIYINFYLKLI